MAGRKIAIAIDDSDCSLSAAQWAVNVLVRPQDEVHLVAVRAVVTGGLATVTPLGTAGTVAALTQSYHQAVADEELKVSNMLTTTAAKVLKRRDAHKHMLPPAGGASGVAESIVSWAKAHQVDLLVVGSRGMGATKSTLMSLVGLGSVSNYCLHHLESTAVCVVQGKEAVIKKAQVRSR